jgi:hypothetical protein
MNLCLEGLNKDRTDRVATSVCECQIEILDNAFTKKQYKEHTTKGILNIPALIKSDSLVNAAIQKCVASSGQSTLLIAERSESDFVSSCIKGLQKSTSMTLDSSRLASFCNCQLQLLKSKRITDMEMQTLDDPNSILFYEMIYKCGYPFATGGEEEKNWNPNAAKDINGPASDTVPVLNLNGMTYIKINIGLSTYIWLFDTGASDLLITEEMEKQMKADNLLPDSNYIGIGEYEMANGIVDTCRKYRVDNLGFGKFTINNVTVAVTSKGKKIIAGRSILNKFSQWTLNNRRNALILSK